MKKLIIGFAFVLSMVAVSALALNINAESTTTTGNANEEVNSIFEEFYNDGYYVKDTQIYVDENKVGDELTNYFHAGYSGHLSLNRTTYYEGDELYFSYGSGYGTEIVEVDGETKTVLTRFTMTENGKENEYAVPSLPGMEEYYCTLHDFVVGLHNSDHSENQDLVLNEDWQLNGNVYSSSSTGVLEAYRLFTAPTWLGKTQDNANYISFSKATAEVVGETLVMKLWVSGDNGKLFEDVEKSGDYYLFSKAIIVKDENLYQVKNGGFEEGLDGWTKVGQIGAVTEESRYWYNDPECAEGFEFDKDGNYLFSSYADNNEGAVGTLTSSNFVVGGTGWITFKIGASKNTSLMHVQVVNAETGDILKTFGNRLWSERTNDVKSGCRLIAYKADLSDLLGKEVYVRVVDNAKWDYGCLFFDSLNTYYTSVPGEEFNNAEDLGIRGSIYQVFNGDFERHNLDGWIRESNIGDIDTRDDDWFGSFDKEVAGEPFFSCYAPDQSEGSRGWLQSSTFVVGGNGWITFSVGGAKNPQEMYIQVVDANTGNVLEVLRRVDDENGNWCRLLKHKANLSEHLGKTVYLKFIDDASGDYGLFFIDKINTYHTTVPGNEYHDAMVYGLVNGGFESGLYGWRWIEGGQFAKVTNLNGFWGENRTYNKDGNHVFSGLEGQNWETDPNLEGEHGIVRSNVFVLNENSVMTFKLGGAKNDNTGIRVVNAVTGEVIARFHNTEFAKHEIHDAGRVYLNEGYLIPYFYNFENSESMLCYVEIYDHSSGDWGLVSVDSIVCNATSVPEGSFAAINKR